MSTTFATTTVPATGSYQLDPSHSRIGFAVRHAMVSKVRGSFNEFSGNGHFDADDLDNSHLSLTIEATSIDTRNADRDAHLRGSDFLDLANHPQLTFVSTEFAADGDRYRVTGDLTLRGVTKPVVVEFTPLGAAVDPYGNERFGLEGRATINRSDWGVNFNSVLEAGGVLISEKVDLEFEVSVIRTGN